jgi:hypothetical protein
MDESEQCGMRKVLQDNYYESGSVREALQLAKHWERKRHYLRLLKIEEWLVMASRFLNFCYTAPNPVYTIVAFLLLKANSQTISNSMPP